MKISTTQIQELYLFTRQHFVEYYDLQTELVDHLANDIETIWEEQPKLSFKEARDQSFKKFGVFGFMEVAEERQKAMNKRYFKYLLKHLKQWFELPQFLVTLSIFILFYLLFTTSYASYLFIISVVIFCVWSFYKGILLKREHKKRKEITNKKWLLEDLIFKQASGYGVLFISQVCNVFSVSDTLFVNNTIVVLLSTVFTLTIICSYISLVVLPNEAENLLKKTYPEYNL